MVKLPMCLQLKGNKAAAKGSRPGQLNRFFSLVLLFNLKAVGRLPSGLQRGYRMDREAVDSADVRVLRDKRKQC